MNQAAAGTRPPWTCPFCPLLCDAFVAQPPAQTPGAWALQGGHCSRAQQALARFEAGGAPAPAARAAGQAVPLAQAVAAAAALLRGARQPLFGGLGTDVAGARALFSLAAATGAICDAAGGPALMQSTRALQDRGGFATSLAEVRARADVLLCLGSPPAARYPEFDTRIGASAGDPRWLVLAPGGQAADFFAPVARLAALLEGRTLAGAPAALLQAAQRLQAAQYAVVVAETGALGSQGALLIEALQRIVASLNHKGRAALLSLGGADGGSTVNAVHTWMSGLPLRTRLGAQGFEHAPLAFDAARLLADGDADLLLWLASFGTEAAPPASPPGRAGTPRILIGHPRLAAEPADVFIPVATPGIHTDGHLFRTDGVVLMPLHPVPGLADAGLPTAAAVLRQLHAALQVAPQAAPREATA
jgi:formylmethanofuran dehydrogenase subunit B